MEFLRTTPITIAGVVEALKYACEPEFAGEPDDTILTGAQNGSDEFRNAAFDFLPRMAETIERLSRVA